MTDVPSQADGDEVEELPELDIRGRQAARTAIRLAETINIEPPVARVSRSWRPERVAFAAAMLLLVAGVIGIAFLRDGNEQQALSSNSLVLFPTVQPRGVPLRGLIDLSVELPESEMDLPSDVVYGSADNNRVLIVTANETDEVIGDGVHFAIGEPPEHRQAVWSDGMFPGLRTLTVQLSSEHVLRVMGRGLTDVELKAVGAAAELDDNEVRLPERSVPEGLELIRGVALSDVMPMAFTAGAAEVGYAVYWQNVEEGKFLSLLVEPDDGVRKRASTLLLRGREIVDIYGNEAVMGTSPNIDGGSLFHVLTWNEDGHRVRIVAGGISQDDVVVIARSLEQISKAELDHLTGHDHETLGAPSVDAGPRALRVEARPR